MPEAQGFDYVAVDPTGRRVKGRVPSHDQAAAFARLRSEGLSPTVLRPARSAQKPAKPARKANPTDRETAELIGNLGDLLKAGADMRTALDILAARAGRQAVSGLCKALQADISRGDPLDQAFSRHLGKHRAFIAAMVSAGEAAGDLSGGLSRAAEMIEAQVRLKTKLISILAYPAFVLVSTTAAVLALLLFVIPSLAPLTADAGATPPASLKAMIWASDMLRNNLKPSALVVAALASLLLVGRRAGLLKGGLDRLLLDGPVRKLGGALVFGGFAIALGGMLTAGAPMSETLRLAIRSVGSRLARARLEPVLLAVRQGQTLSSALEHAPGFPSSIARLAAVGEATGALGPMLVRGGRLEEEAAIRRIEAIGAILGPALIVGMGGLVGLVMAGLLSGVSQIGQSALN